MAMASRSSASIAFYLAINLLLFTLTSACGYRCVHPKHKHKHKPKPKPTPKPCPPTHRYPSRGKCPIDALKLGVCANVLDGLIHLKIGKPPKMPCCSLIEGLVDLEAAVCLCTAIRADVLGIHLDVPVSLSLLLNYCGKNVPKGFQCP